MAQIDICRTAQQRADEVRRRAGSRRAEIGLRRIGLAPGQKVRHGLDAGRHHRTDGKAIVETRCRRDWCQVGDRVIRQFFVGVRVNAQHRHRGEQHHAAVRRGGLDKLHRDLAAGAGLVFNHRVFRISRMQPVGHAARDDVGGAARRKAGNDLDVFHGLRPGRTANAGQQCGSAGGCDEVAARKVHGELLR